MSAEIFRDKLLPEKGKFGTFRNTAAVLAELKILYSVKGRPPNSRLIFSSFFELADANFGTPHFRDEFGMKINRQNLKRTYSYLKLDECEVNRR